jgi:hypothetical protein
MITEYVWKKGIFTDPLLQLRTWRKVAWSGACRRRLSHWSTPSLRWRRREGRIGGDVGSYVKYAIAAVYDDWREEKKNSSRLLQAFRRPSQYMYKFSWRIRVFSIFRSTDKWNVYDFTSVGTEIGCGENSIMRVHTVDLGLVTIKLEIHAYIGHTYLFFENKCLITGSKCFYKRF